MAMKIYIVIAYHGEPEERYHPLLESLNSQIGLEPDWYHYIIARSDGGGFFPPLDKYPNLQAHVSCVSIPAPIPGPGWTRQIGINEAQRLSQNEEDWVLMCDIDDKIEHNNALHVVYQTALLYTYTHTRPMHMLCFPPDRYNDKTQTIESPPDYPLIHSEPWSKCLKLSYLRKNDLHFPRTFFSYEDIFLHVCFLASGGEKIIIPYNFYKYTMPVGNPQSTALKVWAMNPQDAVTELEMFQKEFEKWRENRYNLELSEYCGVMTTRIMLIKYALKTSPNQDILERLNVISNSISEEIAKNQKKINEIANIYSVNYKNLKDQDYAY